jgi:hypothetical protein
MELWRLFLLRRCDGRRRNMKKGDALAMSITVTEGVKTKDGRAGDRVELEEGGYGTLCAPIATK